MRPVTLNRRAVMAMIAGMGSVCAGASPARSDYETENKGGRFDAIYSPCKVRIHETGHESRSLEGIMVSLRGNGVMLYLPDELGRFRCDKIAIADQYTEISGRSESNGTAYLVTIKGRIDQF